MRGKAIGLGCQDGPRLQSTANCSNISARPESLTNLMAAFFRDSDRTSRTTGDALYATEDIMHITDEKSVTRWNTSLPGGGESAIDIKRDQLVDRSVSEELWEHAERNNGDKSEKTRNL